MSLQKTKGTIHAEHVGQYIVRVFKRPARDDFSSSTLAKQSSLALSLVPTATASLLGIQQQYY